MDNDKVVSIFTKAVEPKQEGKSLPTDFTPEGDFKRLAEKLGSSIEYAQQVVRDFYYSYPAAIEQIRMEVNPSHPSHRKGKKR